MSYMIPNISQLIRQTLFQKNYTRHQKRGLGFRINFSVTKLKHSETFIRNIESTTLVFMSKLKKSHFTNLNEKCVADNKRYGKP